MFGPILETKRLVLRELKPLDAKDMFEYAHLPEIGPMAGWEPHPNIAHTKSVIQMYHDKKKFGQLGVFAILLKENRKMIGTVELHSYIKGFKAELESPKFNVIDVILIIIMVGILVWYFTRRWFCRVVDNGSNSVEGNYVKYVNRF